MSPASCRTLRCGRQVWDRCRRRSGRGAGDSRSSFAATTSIDRYRSRSLLSICPSAPGARSRGAKARPSNCPRAFPACAVVPRIMTTSSGRGRQPKLTRRHNRQRPVSVKELALNLPKRAWRTISWREGSAEQLSSRFARVRVRAAHHDYKLTESRAQEWLLIEWPEGEKEPTKYWLSTLPKDITFRALVDLTKLRWRIERDYQELKQEVGLGHFEGRGWRGFHHHATLCIAAYGFLVSERETIPPSGPRCAALFKELAVPNRHRPRGATAENRTPRPKLNCNHAPKIDDLS